MWSDKYYYLGIYKDESLGDEVPTSQLRDFISDIPELEQSGGYGFKNKKSFPFIQLLLLKAISPNNWNENDTNSKMTNLITIVCSKGEQVEFKELERVLIKIASFLKWTLVDEETDDGTENNVIWKPE